MKKFALLLLLGLFAPLANAQLTPFTGAVQVGANFYQTCALDTLGAVSCWGDNFFGQLGDGTNISRAHPVVVVGLDRDVTAIAVGGIHACALKTSGEVWCWGSNGNGELGDGSGNDSAIPVQVVGLGAPAQSITAGDGHSCAVTTAGALLCWGDNFQGQLGDNSQTDRPMPVPVSGLGSGVQAVVAGSRHTCALAGGAVSCWGLNLSGQLGDGTTTQRLVPVPTTGLASGVSAISAGFSHNCALASSTVSCWGENSSGQVGDGSTSDALTPQALTGLTSTQAIAITGAISCAIDTAGALQCWGNNATGTLGDGTTTDRTTPVAVTGLSSGVTGVASGEDHTCALRNGDVHCWGDNASGQLGDGIQSYRTVAATISGTSGTNMIAGGGRHTCAINGGALRCWGSNVSGQLGDGSTDFRQSPVGVTGLGSGVQTVAAGANNSCAINGTDGVMCWGSNLAGALGNGVGPNQPTPVAVAGLGTGMQSVTAGDLFGCALTDGGAVWCWGYNNFGQLGNGNQTDQPTPVAVSGLGNGVAKIAAGKYHACAVTTASTLQCWGFNGGGRLGDGGTTTQLTPVSVASLGNTVQAVATGDEHSCALSLAGAVSCWGQNFGGPLPTPVAGLSSGVQAIAAGGSHSCALTSIGEVRCWGDNNSGQLGDGSVDFRSAPTPVINLGIGVQSITAGGRHTCVITASGSVSCWGSDENGQLGDGGRDPRLFAAALLDITERRIVAAVPPANAEALAPAPSASGRYIAFQSLATDLAAGDPDASYDIYRVDTECVGGLDESGAACERVIRASLDDDGATITGQAIEPSISANGQLIVFVADDLGVNKVHGESAKRRQARKQAGGMGVYMRNMITGNTFRMGAAPGVGTLPQISPAANAAVFTQPNAAIGPGKPGQPDIYLLPLPGNEIGIVPENAICISCKTFNDNGTPSLTNAEGASSNPVLSADGTWVAWQTQAKNVLTTMPTCMDAGNTQIMLRNLVTGATQRVGVPASAANCSTNGGSMVPKLDYSGSKLVFGSDQPLTPGATGSNVYLLDLVRNAVQRVSTTATGGNTNGNSDQATISGDGQTIVFVSTATDIDANEFDSNQVEDLVVYSVKDNFRKRLARTATGSEANRASRRPALNYMGNRLVFDSEAGNLTADSQLDQANVYERLSPINLDRIFTAPFE